MDSAHNHRGTECPDCRVARQDRDKIEPRVWWIDFEDEEGSWLGVAYVEADSLAHAITKTHDIGIHPGGRAAVATPCPLEWSTPAWRATWCDRLLDADEVDALPAMDLRRPNRAARRARAKRRRSS